jgi:carboxyl-terminal processing protease
MRSLIFDLRGDPGGLLDQGVAIADLFLDPSQKIVSMRGRGRDAERDYVDRFPQAWPDMRLVVLVDSGSASASEIVAGALQDHDRALIVGTTSFGKGSAQSLFPMAEGGALKLTTALWFTPSGRSINKVRSTADDEDGGDPLQALGEEAKRPRFRTDAGRTVLGGGGITPDVEVSDSAAAAMEHRLQVALGRSVPAFRDAMASYALSLRTKGVVSSASFVVTPAMRAELYDRLRQRKLVIAPAIWEDAAPLVNRLLGYQIARYVLGPAGEFARVTHDDPEINRSLSLLESAQSQSELFEKAGRR